MNQQLRLAKQLIRPYLAAISTEALWQLCATAKDGQIAFLSQCRCIRGIVGGGTQEGYHRECSPLAVSAEEGLAELGFPTCTSLLLGDHYRNIRLLPMVRAEIRRRDHKPVSAVECEALAVGK